LTSRISITNSLSPLFPVGSTCLEGQVPTASQFY
jgi:hypothetical protein